MHIHDIICFSFHNFVSLYINTREILKTEDLDLDRVRFSNFPVDMASKIENLEFKRKASRKSRQLVNIDSWLYAISELGI